jgi:hypothetical protein
MNHLALQAEFVKIITDERLLLTPDDDGPIEEATVKVYELQEKIRHMVGELQKEKERHPTDSVIKNRIASLLKLNGIIEDWFCNADYQKERRNITGVHDKLKKILDTKKIRKEGVSVAAEIYLLSAGLPTEHRYFIKFGPQRIIWMDGHGVVLKDTVSMGYIECLLINSDQEVGSYFIYGGCKHGVLDFDVDNEFRNKDEESAIVHDKIYTDPSMTKNAIDRLKSEIENLIRKESPDSSILLKKKEDLANLEYWSKNSANFEIENAKDQDLNKARKNVSEYIKRALADIQKQSIFIYDHFNSRITTGGNCKYDSKGEPNWIVDLG